MSVADDLRLMWRLMVEEAARGGQTLAMTPALGRCWIRGSRAARVGGCEKPTMKGSATAVVAPPPSNPRRLGESVAGAALKTDQEVISNEDYEVSVLERAVVIVFRALRLT